MASNDGGYFSAGQPHQQPQPPVGSAMSFPSPPNVFQPLPVGSAQPPPAGGYAAVYGAYSYGAPQRTALSPELGSPSHPASLAAGGAPHGYFTPDGSGPSPNYSTQDPLPPPQYNTAAVAGDSNKGSSVLGQHPAGYAHGDLYVTEPPERDSYANEAVQSAAAHWAQESARRQLQGEGDGDGPHDHLHHLSSASQPLVPPASKPERAASRGGGGRVLLEFVVGSPAHVKRLACLLLVTLFGVVPLMSSQAFISLLCGLAATYMADYAGYSRGAVVAVLATVTVFSLALLLSNLHAAITSFGPMLMILNVAGVLCATAAAALLHFRWLQSTYPELVCAMERLVMATTPVLALPSLLATITALVGSRYAAFYFLAAMCTIHHLFFCPLRSSFLYIRGALRPSSRLPVSSDPARAAAVDAPKASADTEDDDVQPQQLNGRTEAILYTVLLLVLPAVVYNAFQSNWEDHILANMLNTMGLLVGPVTYLCLAPMQSLWFLAPERDAALQLLEYDPLGLRRVVEHFRLRVLGMSAVIGVHWAAYRLLNSRYGYVFNGIPYPYNIGVLLIAFYICAYVAIETKRLVDADAVSSGATGAAAAESAVTNLRRRAPVVLLSMLAVVLFCALGDAPAVFYVTGVMSIASLNVFLLDRTNAGPMVSFTVFSSLLLLWWMYRTFSFIVVDLRVFGEAATVPTPLVAVNVLWTYVLGCIAFTTSFSPSKFAFLVVLFLHAVQVTWVEHVLYTQAEEGVYPAVLVFATTAVGVAMAVRLYANKVLEVSGASAVAACYLAKLITFFVEVASAYYQTDMDTLPHAAKLLAAELTGGWWVAAFAAYIVIIFEMERRRRMEPRQASRMLYIYVILAVLLVLCTIRNVQRGVYEFITRSYVATDELAHIAPGTAMLTYALLTFFFMKRQVGRYPLVQPLLKLSTAVAVLGIIFLAVQPTRVAEDQVSGLDYELPYAHYSRYASMLGLCFFVGSRVFPLGRLPFILRLLFWFCTAAFVAFGTTTSLLPVPTFSLFCCAVVFMFLMLLVVDLAHYGHVTSMEGWLLYGLTIVVMIAAFVVLGRVDLFSAANGNLSMVWEMHEQGRLHLLAVVAIINLFLAVLLKCRLSGRPLLPGCAALTSETAEQMAVVCNYATLLAVCALSVLNYWGSDNEPGIYVLLSLLLLLLVDDDVLFYDLHKENFRYFPTVAAALAMLWICAMQNAWASADSLPGRILKLGFQFMYALPSVPSQVSLLLFLWQGRHRATQTTALLVLTAALNVPCLFSSSKAMQWMAIVGICCQCVRLFELQMHQTRKGMSARS